MKGTILTTLQLIMEPLKNHRFKPLFVGFSVTCTGKHLSKSLTGHKNLTQWSSMGAEVGWRMDRRVGES